MTDNSKFWTRRAGSASLTMLKVPIGVNFIAPTFPKLEMFLVPAITVELVEKWLVWFQNKLSSFINEGKPFFEANRVVLFPDTLPYAALGVPTTASYTLEKLHTEICSLARMSVVMEATNRRGTRVAAEQAIANISKVLELLRKHGSPSDDENRVQSQPHLTELVANHEIWFTNFKFFIEHNLESGRFHNEEIRSFGNYRHCPISQWIYEDESHVWFNCCDEELLRMEANHKHFHAMVHVEAQVAAQLRSKSLNSLELFRLKEMVGQRVAQLEKDHRDFLDGFSSAFIRLQASGHQLPRPNKSNGLEYLPWERLKKDVAEWKEKILRFAGTDADKDLERSLSHVGCPIGQRIEYALSNPSLYFLNEFGLKLLDQAHMQFHVTGSVIYTLVRLGFSYDACALFNLLNEEEKDLLEHLKQNAPLLRISNAA